ncbi:MAG: metX [Flavisolibacter sp.]|jgi:homoserine O-acetyltransferase|nr:metX [Flavisolibacter sp.]
MQVYHHKNSLILESGKELPELEIAYHTWGKLNEKGDNVIWICHALTANSAAQEWWKNLIGEGLAFDTNDYFIICDNILGSCYGTTGPSSTNPETGHPFYTNFPAVTIRDMVQVHDLLRQHLRIQKIHLLVGGSMGGYQALEWCVMQPQLVSNLFLLTTSAKESPWGIAIHTAQRMAIELDSSWKDEQAKSGNEGLKIARAIGMITYRSYETFIQMQSDNNPNKLDDFKAASYIKYQGNKLADRFSAHSYWTLTKAMDTHNLARGREDLVAVLSTIKAKALIIGITSDILCPLPEQQIIADGIPEATFVVIDSVYGHDGFLVETEAITHHLSAWLKL